MELSASHFMFSVAGYVRRAQRCILGPVRRWAYRAQFDTETYRGISLKVHFLAPTDAGKHIRQALDLIAEEDPLSFAKLKTYLTGGIAAGMDAQAAATYERATKTCYLSPWIVEKGGRTVIATCILHELCHARLFARGFGYDAHLRVRIEKICMRREIAFLRKYQRNWRDTPRMVSALQDLIDMTAREISGLVHADYTTANLHKLSRQRHIAQLRLLKRVSIPRWLRRAVVLRARQRIRRRRAADSARFGA